MVWGMGSNVCARQNFGSECEAAPQHDIRFFLAELCVTSIERMSRWMQIFESGFTLDNMAWCHCHTFVVNSDDKDQQHKPMPSIVVSS